MRRGTKTHAAIAEIKVTVAELLRPLSVAICLAFFIINFVFCRASPARDASLWRV